MATAHRARRSRPAPSASRRRARSCTARKHGLVPGTDAPPDELLAIGDAIGRRRPRRVPARVRPAGRRRASGRGWPRSPDAPAPPSRTRWRRRRYAPDGLPRRARRRRERRRPRACTSCPRSPCRPTGMLFGLQSSLHPFITHPTYRALADLPLAERVAAAAPARGARRAARRGAADRQPDRPRADVALGPDLPARRPARLRAAPDDERRRRGRARGPPAGGGRARLAARARRRARCCSPRSPATSTATTRRIREMMTHPRTVLGLSDGGAHCGLICDVSMPTYLLTHWVRDRTRGERLAARAGRAPADRPHRGDLRLHRPRHARARQAGRPQPRSTSTACTLHAPEMVFDLPAGGRRLVQRVDGYRRHGRGRRGRRSRTASPPATVPGASSASDHRLGGWSRLVDQPIASVPSSRPASSAARRSLIARSLAASFATSSTPSSTAHSRA